MTKKVQNNIELKKEFTNWFYREIRNNPDVDLTKGIEMIAHWLIDNIHEDGKVVFKLKK